MPALRACTGAVGCAGGANNMRLILRPIKGSVLTVILGLAALPGEGICPSTALAQGSCS